MKVLTNYEQFSTAEIKGVIVDTDRAKDIVRKLLEFVADQVISDEQQKGCFMVNTEVEIGPHDKEIHNIVLANDQEMEDTLYMVLKKGQESGEIKNQQNPRALARFLLNNLKGIRVTAKSTSDKAIFKDIIQLAVSTLD